MIRSCQDNLRFLKKLNYEVKKIIKVTYADIIGSVNTTNVCCNRVGICCGIKVVKICVN